MDALRCLLRLLVLSFGADKTVTIRLRNPGKIREALVFCPGRGLILGVVC